MPELIQRVTLQELSEIIATCGKCGTKMGVSLHKLHDSKRLTCPGCDNVCKDGKNETHINNLASALIRLQELANDSYSTTFEFILRSPTKP